MDMAASCMACPIRSSTWVFMGRFRDGSTVARLHAEIRMNMLSTPTPGERREGWDIIRYSAMVSVYILYLISKVLMILQIHFHILLEYITSDNYNYSQHGVKVFIYLISDSLMILQLHFSVDLECITLNSYNYS